MKKTRGKTRNLTKTAQIPNTAQFREEGAAQKSNRHARRRDAKLAKKQK